MADIAHTQLRFVSSKELEKVLFWVNHLPYKVEIKGNPIFNKKWYLFFILPDKLVKEITSGSLD